MRFDSDNVSKFNLNENFIEKQQNIRSSYERISVTPSFSCFPYEIFHLPEKNTQVLFAETNAAIYTNSIAHLKTNKESAFSALTDKSPYSDLRKDKDSPNVIIQMKVDNPNELTYGMLGFFAGKVANNSVKISGVSELDNRSCKSLCTGMGTSGTCGKFILDDDNDQTEKNRF